MPKIIEWHDSITNTAGFFNLRFLQIVFELQINYEEFSSYLKLRGERNSEYARGNSHGNQSLDREADRLGRIFTVTKP